MSECVVYRMFDAEGGLLWVGMSTNFPSRLASHRSSQEWWPEVTSVSVQHFDGRHEAARVEREAIAGEKPRHNKAPGNCVSWDTRAERDARRAAAYAQHDAMIEARDWWNPEPGEITCSNCGRCPTRFPRRRPVEDVECKRCGVKAFALTPKRLRAVPDPLDQLALGGEAS